MKGQPKLSILEKRFDTNQLILIWILIYKIYWTFPGNFFHLHLWIQLLLLKKLLVIWFLVIFFWRASSLRKWSSTREFHWKKLLKNDNIRANISPWIPSYGKELFSYEFESSLRKHCFIFHHILPQNIFYFPKKRNFWNNKFKFFLLIMIYVVAFHRQKHLNFINCNH